MTQLAGLAGSINALVVGHSLVVEKRWIWHGHNVKRRRWIQLFAVGLAAIVAFLICCYELDKQPVYKGKRLSEWVEQSGNTGDLVHYFEATDAIRAIGTNALPCFLKWVEYDSPRKWRVKLATAAKHLPGSVRKSSFVRWVTDDDQSARGWRAASGFQILGPQAKSAIPMLAKLLNRATSETIAKREIEALAAAGPEAVPVLLTVLTNRAALRHLVRDATTAICSMGTNAQPAIPMLVGWLRTGDSNAAANAALVLGQLRFEPEIVIPALADSLQVNATEPNWVVRWFIAGALGNFGHQARPAVPALIKMLSEPNDAIREAATNALMKIAPDVPTSNRHDGPPLSQ